MRIAVTGAAGRMGRTLIELIHEAEDLTLGAALEHPQSPALGADAGELVGAG
jgi:4-hydroxy-tetrahydrodipicolinate reductase